MATTVDQTEQIVEQEIPTTMKAVVAYAPRDFRLEQVPVPEVGLSEVLVKVEANGICAGDVKLFKGAESFWGGGGQPAWVKAPVIPGHELLGRVVRLGEGAAEKYGLSVGDRVISEQIVPCWECRFCKEGQYWMCEVHDIYGFQNNVNGGYAEYMKYPAKALVYKVPDEIPMKLAILIEPLGCSIHAVERAQIQFRDVVVLSGAGPLGLGMIGPAKLKNPALLIVLDMNDERLELAKNFGADMVMNPGKEDVVTRIKELTDGYGCDVYIEATGHPSSVIQGLSMIRKLGRFVEFSVFNDPVTVDWSIIGDRKELDIYGAHLSAYTFPLAINYLHNRLVNMEGVVTHVLPVEEFERGIEMVASGKESIKVVLVP